MILFSLCFIFHIFNLQEYLAEAGLRLQILCNDHVVPHEFKKLTAAVVCGAPLSQGPITHLFQLTGLVHLLVVSGGHLVFLERILHVFFSKVPRFQFFLGFLLFVFTLLTGFQPPCVRAFTHWCLQRYSKRTRLFWRPWQTTLISGLGLLLLFPNWLSSYSFLLSWGCALAVSVRSKGVIRKQITLYVTLLPFLLPLSAPHPYSIILNLFITPLFGLLIFPLGIFHFAIPQVTSVLDLAWLYLVKGLEHVSKYMPPFEPMQLPKWGLWIYLIGIHFLIQSLYIRRQRRENSDRVIHPRH